MTKNEAKATVAGYLLDSGVPHDDISEILDALTSINKTEPSLDGVIKKYTEVTNRWIREAEKSSQKNDREEVDMCLFHAVENHQITKWLTELKELRGWQESLKPRLPDFCPNCGASMARKMPKGIKEND